MIRGAAVVLAACGHAASPAVPAPAKSVQLNAPGAHVDVEAALVPGYVTVVDFWAESCGACGVVGGMLAVGVAQQPLVVIRKVDGEDVASAPTRQLLLDAGFVAGYRGLTLRGAR